MLRLNREKNSLATKVKKNCANYNTGYKCSGVMINKNLNQRIDSSYIKKTCKIKRGKECEYYNKLVRPIADL